MRTATAWVGLAVGFAVTHGALAGPIQTATDRAPAIALENATLPSGVRMVMNVERSAPTVASCLVIATGSRDEGPSGLGLASLALRAALQGQSSTPPVTSARAVVASRGGELSTEVGPDATSFCITVPANELALAMWAQAGYLSAPLPDQATQSRLLHELREESRRLVQTRPYETGWAKLQQLAYQGFAPYEYPPVLSAALIDDAAQQLLPGFLDRHYLPGRAVLALVGDFEPARAVELANAELGRRRLRTALALPRRPVSTLPRHTSPRYGMLQSAQAPDVAMFFGWSGPGGFGQEQAALELAATLLGDGPSSRLGRLLLGRPSQVREVDAWMEQRQGPSLLAIRIVLDDRSNPTQIEHLVEQKVTELVHGVYRPDHLEVAKEQLRAKWMREIESGTRRARWLGLFEGVFGDAGLLGRRLGHYEALTAAEVRKVAMQYLRPWQRSEVEVYPPNALIEPSTAMKRFHIVGAGETLIGISRRYAVKVDDLTRLNGIRRSSPIFPGQKLEVPRGAAGKKKPRSYTVKKGDTLIAIAKKHGVTVQAVTQANGITRKKAIQPGQRLVIPGP